MEFRVFTEPQNGATYDDQLAIARAAETLGFNAFFRSDHYLAMDNRNGGLPGPTDSWTTLAGLARETSTIRLGTLVSSATHRVPAILAIQVAQVDEMSGGRVEFGLGTGWFEQEHVAYGIPFPTKRFGILEEQLEIITGLWSTPIGSTYSFSGEHYTLVAAPALPKPVQSPMPVIVGGGGPTRTPAIAARFASEYNAGFTDLAEVAARYGRVRAACAAIGRDPKSITLSFAGATAAGAAPADVARRADDANTTAAELRGTGFAGSATEIVDKLGALEELGTGVVYFQVLNLRDLDHIDFIAREVLTQLA